MSKKNKAHNESEVINENLETIGSSEAETPTADEPTVETPTAETPTVETPTAEKEKKDEKNNKLAQKIIILLLLIIIIILLLRSCGNGTHEEVLPDGTVVKVTNTPKPGLEIDDGEDWDGNSNTNFTEAVTEYTTIPGFSLIVVNEKNKEIQLYNPPENTVYFIYRIKDNDSGNVVHETKAIAPGKAVKWNVYDNLGKGKFNVKIEISTFDVQTQEECYGAVQDVNVTVQ